MGLYMTYEEAFANLRNVLAQLYQDEPSARMVAEDAGINDALINFSGNATTMWHFILKEAENTGRFDALEKAILRDYGENQNLVQAIKAYRDQVVPTPPDPPSSPTVLEPFKKLTSFARFQVPASAIGVAVLIALVYFAYNNLLPPKPTPTPEPIPSPQPVTPVSETISSSRPFTLPRNVNVTGDLELNREFFLFIDASRTFTVNQSYTLSQTQKMQEYKSVDKFRDDPLCVGSRWLGGVVRLELTMRLFLNDDGSVSVHGKADYYAGSSCDTNDKDGTELIDFKIAPDKEPTLLSILFQDGEGSVNVDLTFVNENGN